MVIRNSQPASSPVRDRDGRLMLVLPINPLKKSILILQLDGPTAGSTLHLNSN